MLSFLMVAALALAGAPAAASDNGYDPGMPAIPGGSRVCDRGKMFDSHELFDLLIPQRPGERRSNARNGQFGHEDDVPKPGTARWYGVAQYFSYEYSERLTPTVRLELFDDVVGRDTGSDGLPPSRKGGMRYHPAPWLTLRPEMPHDNKDAIDGRHRPFKADLIFHW